MDPEKLLEEVCRERIAKAGWRKKLEWWWQNRCPRCGAKMVIGLIKTAGVQNFKVPVCEWCARIKFYGTKFYKEEPKMISKENALIGLILLMLAFMIFACAEMQSKNQKSWSLKFKQSSAQIP